MLATAGELSYKCAVRTELSLGDSGALSPYPRPQHVGASFEVDRVRGTIVGAPMRNLTAQVQVLQRGDAARTFELLAVASPTEKATTDLLVVHEFVKGKSKPFLAMTSIGVVYAGVCE